MTRFRGGEGNDSPGDAAGDSTDEGPTVACEFQDGTLSVSEDEVRLVRPDRSKFDDKTIPMAKVRDVTYAKRLVISYIQIEQEGFENEDGGFLSTPVDENTLHFGRGKRDCAIRARDAIFDRMTET